ncbi:aminomethyltransferase [Cnuibacter physcomitrellae]|uniref:aminomethyltransferase n=1 Tax=Cnuibacter physcomitrellae TaxID=1619308 RepID=A0A1X9LTQ2_9MICO|nr:glycine cleavage system aminomethyltransferase GcvT [Cnuibacter physcomitrellae]ARJ07331.1 glycine cleavage system protein T [Cnuibacter physcomitrellae]GGI36336.1 aminomethyltransferase [Cnuibacter physcomitrellae]
MPPESSPSRPSPLQAEHEAAGASFVDFAGWSMPVRFDSDLAEHRAVREAAGLFDLSHMAQFTLTGPAAAEAADHALVSRVQDLEAGRAKYSLLLDDDGGVLDDVVVYRLADDEVLVIANAANHDVVVRSVRERVEGLDVIVTDLDDRALIAVQGPQAAQVLAETQGLEVDDLGSLGYYRIAAGSFGATPVLLARTGYTGEDGFEISIPASEAAALWRALRDAGEPLGLVAAGLAARDTLRLEAGMPLYGHELGTSIRPPQAALARVVAASSTAPGAEAARSPLGPDERRLVGLVGEGRRAPRAGYAVFPDESATDPIGEITSGALSPTLGHPIAMAYVDPASAASDTTLYVDLRGSRLPVTVVSLPFYRRKKD